MAETSNGEREKWDNFRYFLGNWTGSGSGKPGVSSVERSYTLILSDQFIQIEDRAVYEPQEANPSGEIHEELGFISYDKGRSQYALREFHVEGFVNQYMLGQDTNDGTIFNFVSESIENIDPGWQARTRLEVLSEDSFRETFDLAGPGQEWACFITIEFQRIK